MRAIVVGMGVQGKKRRRFAGADYVGCVDPVSSEADYRDIRDVPLDTFDAALCCVPDEPKIELLTYLAKHGKDALVEKPLWASSSDAIKELDALVRRHGTICYVAYNHRFEPHFVRMRDLLSSNELGRVYSCRLFYGNGTARLVRESAWRDTGAGVLPDLGSHLLDTCRFWFGASGAPFRIVSANCFENRTADHVVIASTDGAMRIELEMTLLSWRNHFTCDILAERGSAHIESLCKWGPASFMHRKRVLPSGSPSEERITLTQDDPTWALEYAHFKHLCETRTATSLVNDIWLEETLGALAHDIDGLHARESVS